MSSFEDYLDSIFMEDVGYMFLDDDLPDKFEDWLATLDVNDVMEHAEEWGRTLTKLE
jgi:hypothetical protein